MGFKATDACLAKVAPNEPIFVLRAQDALAANIVRQWASLAEIAGAPREKVEEARQLADKMETWPTRRMPT